MYPSGFRARSARNDNAAKRVVDMRYVSRLERSTAERHFRWRPAVAPGSKRYSEFGAADRLTPSWSMTKAITCTVIGRLIQEGWVASVYDPAPAPLWRDPRSIHRLITVDHLLRMRSGLGFPVSHGAGRVTFGFENSAVYQDAGDAFEAAQRSARGAALPARLAANLPIRLSVLANLPSIKESARPRHPLIDP
jgi:CubicO group peptidase (beta-lactamase class C family)